MKANLRQRAVIVGVLSALVIFLLGLMIGMLVGRQPVPLPRVSESIVGLGVPREQVVEHFSSANNGAYQFAGVEGVTYDSYYGKSEEIDAVNLLLNGPAENLQQIRVGFTLENIGRFAELRRVLTAIAARLQPKFSAAYIVQWIDAVAPKVENSTLQITTDDETYRFILRAAPSAGQERSYVLTIEPAVSIRKSARD